MDPLVWTTIAELWWIGPAVIGGGTVGWLGLRHERRERARRIAYDAAKLDLRTARQELTAARTSVKITRAEFARAQADRMASRATAAEVAETRQRSQQAQRELKAAAAALRAARARVTAARAALPTSATPAEKLPLAQLIAHHDAVTARWMSYETDAAKLLAFPAMSDGRHPLTAAYLSAQAEAMRLRPRGPRVSPAEYTAYREAVARAERAFEAAEADAWRLARAAGTASAHDAPPGSVPPASAPWSVVAQGMIARSAESLSRATEAAAAAFESARQAAATAFPPAPAQYPPETPRRSAPATGPAASTPGRQPRSGAAGPVAGGQPSATADEERRASAAPPQPRDDGSPPWPVPRRG